jgi:hypothetical protein
MGEIPNDGTPKGQPPRKLSGARTVKSAVLWMTGLWSSPGQGLCKPSDRWGAV